MAYITQLFKKLDKEKMSEQEVMHRQNDKIFVFILVLSAVVIAIDYALIIKFIDMIKNL
ncbi:MAG: hypothetical protein J6J36_04645 [Clostridia bacterium]|nr:hypothetical protein [Clostridia bacterium]